MMPSGMIEVEARRAVDEMVQHGVAFTIKHRDDGRPDFLWELPAGGNRSRCRAIIAEAKRESAGYWREFVNAIVEHAGGPAR